jgi:hypothetical protein
MLLNKWIFLGLLMDKAGEGNAGGGSGGGGQGADGGGNGSGGGGSSGVLDDDAGAGSGSGSKGAGEGSGASSGAGSSGGQGDGGNSGGQAGASKVAIPENWKDALPDDLKASKTIEKYKTIQELAKAHENLQKIMGNEKVAIPQKGDAEGLRGVLQKLGLPEKAEDYKIDIDESKTKVDKEFFDGFKAQAHKLGMLPEQSKQLVEWFAGINDAAYQAQMKDLNDRVTAGIDGLKKEWGDAYPENVARAKAALREFGDDASKKFVKESGLNNNPFFIKMLAKVGETLAEGKIKGEGGTGGKHYTPEQATIRIAELRASGAYYDANHADHLSVKKEVSQLYKLANPGKPNRTSASDE